MFSIKILNQWNLVYEFKFVSCYTTSVCFLLCSPSNSVSVKSVRIKLVLHEILYFRKTRNKFSRRLWPGKTERKTATTYQNWSIIIRHSINFCTKYFRVSHHIVLVLSQKNASCLPQFIWSRLNVTTAGVIMCTVHPLNLLDQQYASILLHCTALVIWRI